MTSISPRKNWLKCKNYSSYSKKWCRNRWHLISHSHSLLINKCSNNNSIHRVIWSRVGAITWMRSKRCHSKNSILQLSYQASRRRMSKDSILPRLMLDLIIGEVWSWLLLSIKIQIMITKWMRIKLSPRQFKEANSTISNILKTLWESNLNLETKRSSSSNV